MKSLTIPIAVIAFALGFFAHWVFFVSIYPQLATKKEVARHWDLVNEYKSQLANPGNFKEFSNGLVGMDEPYDVMPSLAALVANGQLKYVDLIFPSVPSRNETNRQWMQFVNDHDEAIVFAVGNSHHYEFQPSGEAPLHLKLWFRPNSKTVVQQLIKELEAIEYSID